MFKDNSKYATPFFSETIQYLHATSFKITEKTPVSMEELSVLCYVKSGDGTFFVNGLSFPIYKGAFIWIHSFHAYSFEPDWESELELYVCRYDYSFLFYVSALNYSSEKSIDFIYNYPVTYLVQDKQIHAESLFKELFLNNLQNRNCSLIKSAVYGELSLLFTQNIENKESHIKHPLIWDILFYLGNYYNSDISAKKVAENFGITTLKLNYELRMQCGYNFSQFLNRQRINYACDMLFYDDLPMNYILHFVGYRSEVAFYRAFKTFKGITPNEYRHDVCTLNQHAAKHSSDTVFLDIFQYILENYQKPITVETAAKELYINKNIIKAKTFDYFGTSFQKVINNFRMRHAVMMLSVSELPIIDIAISSGFDSSHTFIRLFKKEFDITPGKYRKLKTTV